MSSFFCGRLLRPVCINQAEAAQQGNGLVSKGSCPLGPDLSEVALNNGRSGPLASRDQRNAKYKFDQQKLLAKKVRNLLIREFPYCATFS
jgi:hypothetical protein